MQRERPQITQFSMGYLHQTSPLKTQRSIQKSRLKIIKARDDGLASPLLDEHKIKENQPVGERACPQGSGSPTRANRKFSTQINVLPSHREKSYGERCRSTSICQSPHRATHAEEVPSPPHFVASKHPEFLSLNRPQC